MMKRKVLLSSLVLFLLFIGLFVFPYFANIVMPWNKSEVIKTAFDWGGLDDLPEKAYNVSVEQKGSMFSRQFIVTFKCPNNDITNWALKSHGMVNVESENLPDGSALYHIPGKNGSIGGTVKINRARGTVIVNMSWS
jgi:hypothetical protein